jgi:copper chaperone CopZ
VKDAKVKGDRAFVEYDTAKVTPKAVADSVHDLGYEAVLPPVQSR